jgi:hypothetical protein
MDITNPFVKGFFKVAKIEPMVYAIGYAQEER